MQSCLANKNILMLGIIFISNSNFDFANKSILMLSFARLSISILRFFLCSFTLKEKRYITIILPCQPE